MKNYRSTTLLLLRRGVAGRWPVRLWGENGGVSFDGLVGLRLALAQELVKDDGTEGSHADATDGKATDDETGVAHHARADGQRHGSRDQIAALREVDFVLDPDTTACRGDEAEEHYGQSAEHAGSAVGQCGDQRAKLGAEAQQDGNKGRDDEDECRVDARDRHDANIFGIGSDTGASPEARNDGGDGITQEGAAQVLIQVA